MATTIETDLKEVLGDIQKELKEIRGDLNDLKVSQAEIRGDLATIKVEVSLIKEDVKDLKGNQRSQIWVLIVAVIGELNSDFFCANKTPKIRRRH